MEPSPIPRNLRALYEYVVTFFLNWYSYTLALSKMAMVPRWFCQFVLSFWNNFVRIWWTELWPRRKRDGGGERNNSGWWFTLPRAYRLRTTRGLFMQGMVEREITARFASLLFEIGELCEANESQVWLVSCKKTRRAMHISFRFFCIQCVQDSHIPFVRLFRVCIRFILLSLATDSAFRLKSVSKLALCFALRISSNFECILKSLKGA